MVCRRVTSFPQLLTFLTLIILLTFGKTFSHARRVLEVSTVVASTDKEFAVHGGSGFSSHKETNIVGGDVPSAAAQVKTNEIGGRRMNEKGQNTEAASSAGDEKEEHWRQVFMAFAVDYSSPRAHPPSHN